MNDTKRKKTTIHFDAELHAAARRKAAHAQRSLSGIVNDAVRVMLREDEDTEDLAAFDERADEPVLSHKALLRDLKAHDKL